MENICSQPQCPGKPAGLHQCSVSPVQLKVSEHAQITSPFSKNGNLNGLRYRSRILRFYENNFLLAFHCNVIFRLSKLLRCHCIVTVRIFSERIIKMEISCIFVSSLQLRTAIKCIISSSIDVDEVAPRTSWKMEKFYQLKIWSYVRWHDDSSREAEGSWVWHKPCYHRRSECHVGSAPPPSQPHQVL